MKILGRIFHIGHVIGKRIWLLFSWEAADRLEELSEMRQTSPKMTIHNALKTYRNLVEARRQGATKVRLIDPQGNISIRPIEDILPLE